MAVAESGRFVRTSHLQAIRGILKSGAKDSPRIAVVGQGGFGKSTLARWCLKDLVDSPPADCCLVFFLHGNDLMKGYRHLLREIQDILGIQGVDPDMTDDDKVRVHVHRGLRHERLQHGWTGVLDDLPCPNSLEGLKWLLDEYDGFPWGSGKTIVTSRGRRWIELDGPCRMSFEVGVFEPDEALAFLQERVKIKDKKGAAEVARRLEYLPLSLVSVVGCVNTFNWTLTRYIEELEKSSSGVLQGWDSRKKLPGEYPFKYKDVMRMAWERLSREGEAQDVLRKLAWLDPSDIPMDVFESLLTTVPILQDHCLISVGMGPEEVISIHAVTQLVVREHLTDTDSRAKVVSDVVSALEVKMSEFDVKNPETWRGSMCRKYAAHVKAVMANINKAVMANINDNDAKATAAVLNLASHTAEFYSKVSCAFTDALYMHERVLEIQKTMVEGDHPDVATSYHNIGVVYYYQGKYEETLDQYQKALAIFLAVNGQDHQDVAASYNNIGNVYEKQGKYEDALVQYQKDLEITTRVVGYNHPDVAICYNNIEVVYEKQGDYENALVQHGRALDIRIRVVGQHHPGVAQSYYGMACAHAPHDKLMCRDMRLKAERAGWLSGLKQHKMTDLALDVVRESEWFKDLILRL